MTPEVYAQFALIARNLSLAAPSPQEPFGSPAWVQFLQRVAKATG
jgi:hypothetical protein